MDINNLLSALIAAGGLGVINYLVAEQLGILEFERQDNSIKVPYLLAWTVPDFAIYLTVLNILNGLNFYGVLVIPIALMVTFVIVFLISLFLTRPIFNMIYKIINYKRGKYGLTRSVHSNTWNYLLDNNKCQAIHIFNLDGEHISSGYLSYYSEYRNTVTQLSVIPFTDSDGETSFDKLIQQYSEESFKKQYEVDQLIDLDKQIKIILISERENN